VLTSLGVDPNEAATVCESVAARTAG
jgi:hypothetical protein